MAGVGGFACIAPVLSIIDADIGPDASITWVAITYILMLGIGSKQSPSASVTCIRS
jgi:hypothetical protein